MVKNLIYHLSKIGFLIPSTVLELLRMLTAKLELVLYTAIGH